MSLPAAARLFLAALGTAGANALRTAAHTTRHAPPANWVLWFCTHPSGETLPVPLGMLSPERAELVRASLPGCTRHALRGAPRLHWDAAHLPTAERSTLLQHALQSWHQHGEVHGWRGEPFAFWAHNTDLPSTDTPPLLQIERAGFRFLGMPSHAVHINGFTPQGLLWCGRRALSKATDPGMLDNVTAGGLPAGESPRDCALRELHEEAGATNHHVAQLTSAGTIRTARQDTGGWHEETLLVYNWTCPEGWTPANQDGEVAEFICLSAHDAVKRITAGDFTLDAVASLAHGLGLTHEAATIAPCF